ncbi:zinc finger protein 208 isoform X3 [Drosophila novamexicana]|uniref:zinc finger protein 208 isoform X3 n=1 Tax=Drosophila novamexicana TaxID=47314 RepID=UPI0011E59DD3|nr:zinc finger protein 208 isoform X3 [Drosophila novamexicana]
MTVAIAAILIEDLGNCCRVCLEQPHRAQMLDMNLIYDEDAQLTYYDCYEICTKDNLLDCGEHEPHKLCKHCGVELQWAYDFYKKVALANKHLKNMHSEAEKEEHSEQIDKDNKDGEEHVLAIEFDKHLVEDPHVIEDTLSDVELEEPAADQSASEPETMSTATNIAFRTANDVIPRQRFLGPFSCQFCKKPFRNHSHMLKHQLIHLSDRPHFKCNVCDRFYLTQQALKVHVDTQHKKSGSACTICVRSQVCATLPPDCPSAGAARQRTFSLPIWQLWQAVYLIFGTAQSRMHSHRDAIRVQCLSARISGSLQTAPARTTQTQHATDTGATGVHA